jgi:hypothetical protein
MMSMVMRLCSIERSSNDPRIADSSSTGNALSTDSVLLTLDKQMENVFILTSIASRVQSGRECLVVVY